MKGSEKVKTAPMEYPLSTSCQTCGRRAWRLFGRNARHWQGTLAYRCPRGHVTWHGLRKTRVPDRDKGIEAGVQG